MFDSKAKYSISVISLSVSLLVGCAASKPEAPSSSAAEAPKAEAQAEVAAEPKPEVRVTVVAEPKAEAQAEVAYVEPSVPKNKERTDWIYNEEVSEENNQVIVVGVSKYHSTERSARKYARREATNKICAYMGTIVKDKFEEIILSTGLESEILDETNAANQTTKQLCTNMVRRLKTKKWHMDQKVINGKVGIQYYVLASMPMSEIDKAYKKSADKNIKTQQRKAENAATEKAKKQAEQAIELFRKAKKEGLMN